MSKKKSTLEFTETAIKKLRKGNYKGIHSVYSGFNEAFKLYYGEDSNPIDAMNALVDNGDIVTRFAKGGVMIYLPQDAPEQTSGGQKALDIMGINKTVTRKRTKKKIAPKTKKKVRS